MNLKGFQVRADWRKAASWAGMVLVIACVVVSCGPKSVSQTDAAVHAVPTNNSGYKELYYGRIADDLAKSWALLQRVDQNDYSTVSNVLELELRNDLRLISMETNLQWSANQEKAIALAREYIQKGEARKK